LRSRRKIGVDLSNANPVASIMRNQKRKARDEEDGGADVAETDRDIRPMKPKVQKRVRVVSYHEEQDTKPNDAEMREHEGIGKIDEEMDDEDVSSDPLCEGRRIGDEWVADGVKYKVGPDGMRLRETMLQEHRPKYKMVCHYYPPLELVTEIFFHSLRTLSTRIARQSSQ